MRSPRCHSLLVLSVVLLAPLSAAQIPAGYYDTVDTTDATSLRSTLHLVIDDHLRFPYTSSATDTWDVLELADQDPSNSTRILDVYRNESFQKAGGGNANYNREHTWPNSYGFPDDNGSNYPYTDCHLLFLCDDGYNSSRGNKPYRNCLPSHDEKVTVFNNGQGGGSGAYPGNSNWTAGSQTSGTWETWIGRRGDVARAQLYADVRYEGGNHGGTGAQEPDLILTDIQALIAASNTGNNESVAYMGMLSVLLEWHLEDPVDDTERARNDVIYAFQGNRNPFIDHPEWVDCLFNDACSFGLGTAFCFGDGTGAACPCANAGAPGHGCANGAFPGGCVLSGSGEAQVAGDTFKLTVEQSAPNQPGLFFQGDIAIAGGAGVAFGDGLRCAGNGVVRLETRVADVFGWTATSISIGAAGGVQAGDTRRYQWWYRDPAGSPCGAQFNLSSGYEVVWQ